MLNLRAPSRFALRSPGILALSKMIGATAATGLAVTDYASQRVFQRVGTSKTVIVSGTYTGPASIIQARAVPDGTALSSTAHGWTTIALSPTGGAFSGSLIVHQGGWYNIQVRDGVNNAIKAAGTNKWGVGILIGLIGQSNMQHFFDSAYQYPLGAKHIVNFDGSAWDRIGNLNDAWPINTISPTYGTYSRDSGAWVADSLVYFCNYLNAALGIPVGTLCYAVSGSLVESWQPGTGSNWTTFANAASGAGGDFESVIWYQGESDAGMVSATYKAKVQAILTGCLSLTGRSSSAFNFGVVSLAQSTGYGGFGEMRKTQIEMADELAGAYYAGTPVDLPLGDSVHVTQAGLARLSKRFAASLLGVLSGNRSAGKGPVISSATRSSNVITVSVTHNGGSALLDGAGGSGDSLMGFRVFENGTPMTISSTAIGGNTIALTLSATPAGTVTLDYAMADAPFGATPTIASLIYDNQSIPGETAGFPMQPKALMAVA